MNSIVAVYSEPEAVFRRCLASVVANATRALAEVFEDTPSFDAATSSYRFVVACSDLFGVLVIPELLRTLKREAEHVEVELRAIRGARRIAQLEDNVKSADVQLSRDEIAKLDALTKPTFGFPQSMQPLFSAIHNGGTTVNGVGAPPTPFGVVKGDQVY